MAHDQYSDRSFRVLSEKLKSFGPDARDLIKTASIDYDEAASLPDTAFAWPEERRYPVHNAGQTALSSIYAQGESLPGYVRGNLQKAAELYDIELSPMEKVAAEVIDDIDDYLIPQLKVGRINSKELVKEAADYFSRNYKKLDLETRTHAAATLIKKARQYNCKISPTFFKHAGLTKCDPKVMGEWLEVRANLSTDEATKGGYEKLASFVQEPKNMDRCQRSELIKIADTISALDEKSGLTRRYDITLPDPILTVFNTTKMAEETLSLANKSVPLSALMGVSPEDYGKILGADILPEITKDGALQQEELLDVLKTLPADLQATLVQSFNL